MATTTSAEKTANTIPAVDPVTAPPQALAAPAVSRMARLTSGIRYFDTSMFRRGASPNAHSEFLRTGRIFRGYDSWDAVEKRYLSPDEVAVRTGRKLELAGERSHERMNSFHRSIRFPKILFHKTLENFPHLGYCHVTAAKSPAFRDKPLRWSFYIANFVSDIGEEMNFVNRHWRTNSRMYFAVALTPDGEKGFTFDRSQQSNGVIFKTSDPKVALKNVLMLGTDNARLRQIIESL